MGCLALGTCFGRGCTVGKDVCIGDVYVFIGAKNRGVINTCIVLDIKSDGGMDIVWSNNLVVDKDFYNVDFFKSLVSEGVLVKL